MSLAAGSKLGPYEVLGPIGAGGMGEVYRARDTRLHRTVAIKLVRRELAKRGDFRERFQREARAISALNHPHICSLYDIGEQDGLDLISIF
jgi:serine/threonine protein kinase